MSYPVLFEVYGVRLPTPTLRGAQLYFGFVFVLFALTKLLPGKQQQGEPLPPDYKKRLMYKINAFLTLCVASVVLYALWSYGVYEPAEFITEYWSIVVVALMWSAFLTVAHYVSARVRGVAETSGNLLVDLWCGVELNPRLFGVDLKMFAYRPGMMGYLLINLAALHRHYQLHGTISDAMILFQFFSGYYCVDFFWFEQVVLPIYDIIEERWGFMLIVRSAGDSGRLGSPRVGVGEGAADGVCVRARVRRGSCAVWRLRVDHVRVQHELAAADRRHEGGAVVAHRRVLRAVCCRCAPARVRRASCVAHAARRRQALSCSA